MQNNKICQICGSTNEMSSQFCTKCGNQFRENNNNKNANAATLGIVSLILFFVGTGIVSIFSRFLPIDFSNAFSVLSGLCPLAGIVIMIVGRIKYPTNKFLKITMWVIILSIILSIILFVLMFMFCYITCTQIIN